MAADNVVADGPRLHVLEVITPLVLLVTLAVFAAPNYIDYRPRADLQRAAESLRSLVVTARKASIDSGAAGIHFNPEKGEAALWLAEQAATGTYERHYELPGTVSFGYAPEVQPFPSLILEDGTNLAATEDGVTFDNEALTFRAGLLDGFPGLVYLKTEGGDALALYVRISGEVQVHEWKGQRWVERPEMLARPD